MRYRKRMLGIVLAFLMLGSTLMGCAKDTENMKVVLTTGFGKDEIFRIEDVSCSKAEIMVYLTNMQNRYESVYGDFVRRAWAAFAQGVLCACGAWDPRRGFT